MCFSAFPGDTPKVSYDSARGDDAASRPKGERDLGLRHRRTVADIRLSACNGTQIAVFIDVMRYMSVETAS